ncbi:hypothetical protein [Seleniivibrio sp.]|uniref:hypothetical protein n=1 Tax=Seleniivibrio sp. TaxID=2898801 RepID=UPI0025D9F5C3|nr:hypothetical protein [Seleniivibrio sp.]MCD8554937.1 hypothetical protein [Seleniivibrio sp.]
MDDRDLLISQYIDNELSLEEKAEFVKEINIDDAFCAETLSMLDSELLMAGMIPDAPPVPEIKPKRGRILTPASVMSFTALAASLLVAFKVFMFTPEAAQQPTDRYRFVIHVPEAQHVALAGSFSDWQSIDMRPVGNGYWQVSVPLEKGEYTYTYILDGKIKIADPASPAKQVDDFGGENSVITIGSDI